MNIRTILQILSLLITVSVTAAQAMFFIPYEEEFTHSRKRIRDESDIAFSCKKKKLDHDISIETAQDIPKISLKKIGLSIEKLAPTEHTAITKQLIHSFTFAISQLPKELKCKIITNMFNGNKALADLYYKTPLLYACKRYHEARTTILSASLPKEKIEKSIMRFFGLPTEAKKIILNTINPPLSTQLIYNGSIISEENLHKIAQYNDLTKKLFKKQNVLLATRTAEKSPLLEYIRMSSILTIGSTFITFPLFAALTIPLGDTLNYCSAENTSCLYLTLKLTALLSSCWFGINLKILRSGHEKISL